MIELIMISAVIVAKNEEENIIDCIQSINFCDEIIVIDDNSSDRTVELIKHLKSPKIHVFTRKLDDFASQRNFGLSKVTHPWVLYIDADERVSNTLRLEILRAVEQERMVGYKLRRIDHIWGTSLRHGEIQTVQILRLAKKNLGKWKGVVHERWEVDGLIGTLNEPLDHYPHQTIREFLDEINCYSDLRARELFQQKKNANVLSIIAYPKAKFLVNYFYHQGYKDGTAGFVFAVMMSFHSFLVRAKLYVLNSKKPSTQ